MFAKIHSAGLFGIHGYIVDVEVNISNGIPQLNMTGALSNETKEGQFRIWNAIKNIDIGFRPQKITVNLSPAFIRKTGTAYDISIAVGILAAAKLIPDLHLESFAFLGELGLDGSIKAVNGVLSLSMALRDAGIKNLILSNENLAEARLVDGIRAAGAENLKEIVEALRYGRTVEGCMNMLEKKEETASFDNLCSDEIESEPDFIDVHGQEYLRRAAEIAVSGRHNILFSGPAGTGKTMIAKRMPGIMPSLTREEDIEISKVYSVRGLLPKDRPLFSKRPFRAPHHGITMASFLGGGANVLPGEISLASGGILFLDELPLFNRSVVEALRQPMEDKKITINRLRGSYVYPADFQLVAACNNCACGHFPDRTKCHCTESQIKTYMGHLSKPLLERIDICAEASPVSYEELTVSDSVANKRSCESSAEIRKRVEEVHRIQEKRFEKEPLIKFNSGMGIHEIERYCVLRKNEALLMKEMFVAKNLSARTYHKVLKVARTISDMDGDEYISEKALIEAVSLRSLEDRLFK
ncbi:MAG: YifB family Mg chelatase-like AAA ATPase [Eubacteriales bacterium]|nr:YifB family Mg chelatase-like AAA ATPase [Eubacteriales bacterium]